MIDNCPMHSEDWMAKAVRTNRRLLGESPQRCTCADEGREVLADLIESVCGRDIGLQADAILASDWLAAHDARVAADARADALRTCIEHPGLAVGSWHPGPAILCDPFCADALGTGSDRIASAATDTEAGQ